MTLRIAIAQLDFKVGDIAGNAQRILDTANEARNRLGAKAVVFPELTLSGYPPEDLILRRDFLTTVEKALEGLARDVTGITAIVGFPETTDEGVYNSAAVLGDGAIRHVYRKQWLPNLPQEFW